MSIDVRNAAYVPTVFLRKSELRAVRELPESSKDLLTPIFALKPWATSKSLNASMEKISSAYPNRPYFLDIDPFYNRETKRPAQEQFEALKSAASDHQSWVDFFDDHPLANPCIQVNHGDVSLIESQIVEFTKKEKVFLVRLDHDHGANFSNVIKSVAKTPHANFGFVVDAGWSTNVITRFLWMDGIVKQIVALRGDDVPIITMASSFPSSFTRFGFGANAPMQERQLFSQLQAANNQAKLVYGDWASSRSPTEGGGGDPIPPRIDLPTKTGWEVYRVNEEIDSFVKLAQAILKTKNFPSRLDLWGVYAIRSTALNQPNAIKDAGMATAVRINLHLFQQLNFAATDPAPNTDDDYAGI